MEFAYIQNSEHYGMVLERALRAERSLWIGTADIKDLYVMNPAGKSIPFIGELARLLRKGIEVRLIHAKEPGPRFREEFDRHKELIMNLERMLCPRVHFKLIIIDHRLAYVGSANLTGAGLGMKGETRRNFEAGILSDHPQVVEQAMNQFDEVWIGKHCRDCGRREFCGDSLDS